MMRATSIAFCCALTLAGCDSGGTSTAEAERAAEERVREQFGLAESARLETTVFVGTPREGETTLCGTVRQADGASFPAQRFVAATDPVKWLVFEQAGGTGVASQPGMFPEWEAHCGGEEGDNADEPLAPTDAGEER